MCGIVGFVLGDNRKLNPTSGQRKEMLVKDCDLRQEKSDTRTTYRVGSFERQNKNVQQILEDMMVKIRHRGPDGSGIYLDESIALGHRRLSVIDIEGGTQPMKNEDGRLVCIFNGEIYNYKELKAELEGKGHQFASNSDTEVLLHGYEEWYKELPKKLRGMFAFVIWDKRKKELFCARDFFGIKPFYYYHKGKILLFGSEIKSFLSHPEFEKVFHREQLELYLTYQYSPGRETFFENVYKLLPAHFLIWKDGNLEIESYWEADFIADFSKERRDWEAELSRVLENSIKAHKLSDVEVGSFLSSGVDSSYIAKLSGVKKTFTVGFVENISSLDKDNKIESAKEYIDNKKEKINYQISQEENKHQKFKFMNHFNYKMKWLDLFYSHKKTDKRENKKYDETSYAQNFSQSIEAENKTYRISSEEFLKELPTVQYYMDEPLADASAVALYFLNREASSHIKVCLSGEGADELFAGYHIYKEPLICEKYDRLPFWGRRVIGKIASFFPCRRGFNFLVRHSQSIAKRYIGTTMIFTEREKKKMMKHFCGKVCPIDVVERMLNERISIEEKLKELNEVCAKKDTDKMVYDDVMYMQMVDLHMWLAGDILLKADKMSMANSLELRVPFLDKEVFEVARKIPTKYKVNTKKTKMIFRNIAGKVIGEGNAKREKCGFPVPIREWLREEPYVSYVRQAFNSETANEFFHTKYLLWMLERHIRGKQDYWRQIWCVYMFLVWYEVYF